MQQLAAHSDSKVSAIRASRVGSWKIRKNSNFGSTDTCLLRGKRGYVTIHIYYPIDKDHLDVPIALLAARAHAHASGASYGFRSFSLARDRHGAIAREGPA